MKMDFSPLCRGRLSTIFRRFTSLLGVGTRLTRIDKTSCSSSPVFSILAGRDSTSRVADKRCHWCKNQVEMGTFLQTNKQTRYRYIHSCQGKFPSFLSKAPVQGGTNHSHWIWLWWRKRCPEKTVENIAQDCWDMHLRWWDHCECDFGWKYSALPLTILLISFWWKSDWKSFELDFWRWVLSSVESPCLREPQLCWSPAFQPKAQIGTDLKFRKVETLEISLTAEVT